MSTTIFENYETFINENKEDFSSPTDIVKLFNSDSMFHAYLESLVDGIDSDSRPGVMNMLNRQREMILTEGANVSAGNFAKGWVVSSFPVLVDIYQEALISQLCNIYPTNSPQITIPKMRLHAVTKSYDGTTETRADNVPTATSLIRASEVTVDVTPGTSANVFTVLGLNPDTVRMNRRYTLLTSLTVTETTAASATINHILDVSFRPDNRNQISRDIVFTADDGEEVVIKVNSNVNYSDGTIVINAIFNENSTSTFTADLATFTLRLLAKGSMNGRTKVFMSNEALDVTIDPNNDFYIELEQEEIQDFQSIYKIDLLQTISSGIKRQILLNKDYDISYFLKASEGEINTFGAKRTVDLDAYAATGSSFRPATAVDVLKSVIPYISELVGVIHKNYGMYPKYLVAGLKTAALLRTLQDFVVSLPTREGGIGFSGQKAEFTKLKILESVSMDNNKIYLSTKAAPNSLEYASIVDLVYQPLYIIKETTNGQSRNFVKSRTMAEVVRADGLGCLQVDNIDNYI